MKIFISWSGDLSKAIALALRDWLKPVIQEAHPFVSEEDIDKGTRALIEIASELESTDVGIVCVTRENHDRPWINFEAGAISKEVGQGRLMPFLINLENADLPQSSPLKQFQTTRYDKDDVRKMVRSINRSSPSSPIDDPTIDLLVDRFWDDLDKLIRQALAEFKEDPDKRTPEVSVGEMVAEILALSRAEQRELVNIRAEIANVNTVGFWNGRQFQFGQSRSRHINAATIAAAADKLEAALGRKPFVQEIAQELGITADAFAAIEAELRIP